MSAAPITPGTPVEVLSVFAHGEPARWFDGYVFVGSGHIADRGDLLNRTTRTTVLVTSTSGIFAGVPIRFDRDSVRPV